jgi:hypothetical protein
LETAQISVQRFRGAKARREALFKVWAPTSRRFDEFCNPTLSLGGVDSQADVLFAVEVDQICRMLQVVGLDAHFAQ